MSQAGGPIVKLHFQRRAVVAALLAGSLAVGIPTFATHGSFDGLVPTSNYNFSNCSTSTPVVCQTDNTEVTIFRGSTLSAAASSNITTALNSWYDITDLNVYYGVGYTTNGSPTDIAYGISSSVPSGNEGYYYCAIGAGGWKCDQGIVNYINNTVITKGLACHETGHAVGQVHGQFGVPSLSDEDSRLECMRTPTPDIGNGDWNRHQINDAYPN